MKNVRIAAGVAAMAVVLAGSVQASGLRSPALPKAPAQSAGVVVDAPAYAVHDTAEPARVLHANAQLVQARMSNSPVRAAAPAGDFPVYSQLLGAGEKVRADGTAVPLPGALWLFGSALLAFLCIAGRRRL